MNTVAASDLVADELNAHAALQQALDAGHNIVIDGRYRIDRPLVLRFPAQSINGTNRYQDRIVLSTSFDVNDPALGVIVLTEHHQEVRSIMMVYPRETAVERRDVRLRRPAIYLENASSCRLQDVMLHGAWKGIDAVGNCGDLEILDCELGALFRAMRIDGHLGRTNIRGVRVWPHGWTHLLDLWGDGGTRALDVGEADAITITGLLCFQAHCRFRTGRVSDRNKGPFGSVSHLMLDGTYANLRFDDGHMDFGLVYSTTAEHQAEDDFFWRHRGGEATLTGGRIRGRNSTNPYIAVTGGLLSLSNIRYNVDGLKDAPMTSVRSPGILIEDGINQAAER